MPTTGHPYSRYNFYPRSPCGERPVVTSIAGVATKFLSTLSLRRATAAGVACLALLPNISIHALLAESDPEAMLLTFLSL